LESREGYQGEAIMDFVGARSRLPGAYLALPVCTLAILVTLPGGSVEGDQPKSNDLRIGTSGGLIPEKKDEKSSLETLKAFIKEETELSSEILKQRDWRELAAKMVKGDLNLGVFQGYEFAWAHEKQPQLKPLALAVNVYRYPVAYVVTQRDNTAKDFDGLKGQSISIPAPSPRFLPLFVDRQCAARGKKAKEYLSKITTPDNVEDALDDVVDGVMQATVTDRAALEAYKRRKPARFNKLKEVAHSQPFPPPLVAYYDTVLDRDTRDRLEQGLLNANKKDKGQTMLTLFRLTGFEPVPEDFAKVLAETLKDYPPPRSESK
jgi:ABC-type phosphate/phosphonate transport system substrate-binding protein